jgi:hypothetical protein
MTQAEITSPARKPTTLRIFVSWSKPASRRLALMLRDWLPEVIQQLEPWVSTEDIDKGQRWSTEIGAKLGELGQGILCITAENQHEAWLNYEAGALAKSLDESRVRPILLDLAPSDVTGPLAQFQATVVSDREDMFRLVSSLNLACTSPLDPTRLERAFDRNWPDFLGRIAALLAEPTESGPTIRRTAEDMIGEILERVRDFQRTYETSLAAPLADLLLGDLSHATRGTRVIVPGVGFGQLDGTIGGYGLVRMDDGRVFRSSLEKMRKAPEDDLFAELHRLTADQDDSLVS